jgi:peptide/nickel transport system permease protein
MPQWTSLGVQRGRFSKNRLDAASLVLLLLIHLVALLAPLLAPYTLEQINLLQRFAPVSAEHPLDTDER